MESTDKVSNWIRNSGTLRRKFRLLYSPPEFYKKAYNKRKGELLCQEETELDLMDRDQKQVEN